jgi:hypothetical protein
MEQSHFIELIRTLTQEEFEQFLLFVTHPYFNQSRFKEQVLLLLDFCMNHPWEDPTRKLGKHEVFKALFPDQDFVEGKTEKVLVEAQKSLRSFLLIQQYFEVGNEFQQTFDFAEIVRTRGLENRYQQLLTRLRKIQADSLSKNERYHYQQFLLEDAIYADQSLHNQVKGDLNIPNVIESLDNHYYVCRYARLNSFLLQQKVARLETPESLKTFIEQSAEPEEYLLKSPILLLNFEIFKVLRKKAPETSDVRSLNNLLLTFELQLDAASLRKFYTYLRNICVLISTTQLDNEEIRITLFELYKDNLSRGYLHYEGRIHPATYLTVTRTAVRVAQFEWALTFIENHKNELIGETEERDIYRFNLAVYYFGTGKFADCLANIPASFSIVDYQVQGKRLELMALYELNSELLPYKLDAFKMYLSRTSQKLLSESHKQTNTDFANMLFQLVSSNPGDSKRSEQLGSRILERTQTAEWRWLFEKAKALK